MKKTFLMMSVAAMACAAAFAVGACAEVRRVCAGAWHWFEAKAEAMLGKARAVMAAWNQPSPMMLAEAEYFRRQAERERPVLSPRWRMAPSV